MKNLFVAFIALVAFGNVALSQTKSKTVKTEIAKVIVMVNTATWCPACKANEGRVEQNVISQFKKNEKVHIVVNDLSNDETKANSKIKCNKAGISDIASNYKGTGVIYFINSKTKAVIAQISITETDDEIKRAFEAAIKKV